MMVTARPAPPNAHRGRRRTIRSLQRGFRALIGLVAFAGAFAADKTIPNRYLPWAMLDLGEEVGPLTRVKLAAAHGLTCRTVLANGVVHFRDIPAQTSGEFCSKEDAVTLTEGVAPLLPRSAVMTCNLAVATALWERQVVQPAARRHFGQAVTRIDHYGTYACRRMYGASDTRVSEHASANALDVASFTLADGRRVSVLSDWRDEGAKGAFLHDVRDGACRVFDVTLSPDYNAAHRNHLHLDMGRGPFCA